MDKARIGPRGDPALVYDPEGKRFLVLGGGISWPIYARQPHPFDDLALDRQAGQWENLFPPKKKWGPRFGDATPPPFKNEVFALSDKDGNVRPNLSTYRGVYYYNQYAYDSDRKRVYFHARGHTFCYDPAARTWTDLAPSTSPTGGKDKPPLLWGSLCYDPVNRKILLFGGGNVQTERGDPGTWTYDPASNTWSQLHFKSAALEELRKQCKEAHAKTKGLAEAVRARSFHAELPDQKEVNLAKRASQLIVDLATLSKALKKANHQADKQEKLQIAWALPEIDSATARLEQAKALLTLKVSAEGIQAAEGARRALGAAYDTLALEPPQRALSRMVYDPVNRQIVLFGGDQLDRLLADTWVFDCASQRWQEKRAARGPSPRGGHALVYLPKSKKILLFGGYTYTSNTDYCGGQYAALPFEMWAYDPSASKWTLVRHVEDMKSVPYQRAFYMSFTTHPAAAEPSDLVVAIGQHGGTQAANAETWTCQVDATRTDAAGTAKHGVKPRTFTERKGPFVPAYFDEGPTPDPAAAAARLKELPANTWVSIVPPRRPIQDRCWGTAVYSPDHDVIMHWSGGHSSHCGTEVVRYHPGIDRWSLATASEQPLEMTYTNDQTPGQWSFQRRPWMTGHTYRSYAYDPVLKKMLFAGKGERTYLFDPTAGDWDKRTVPNPFDGGMYMVNLCPTPRGVVAWSFLLTDRVSTGLWRMDAESHTWKPLPLKGKLPPSSSDQHGQAYDSKRDRLLSFHGTEKDSPGEVTAYDFRSGLAKPLTPAGKQKAALPSREAVYVPEADLVLIQAYAEGKRWLAYDCAKNAWLGVKFAGPDLIGKQVFNNSLGLLYDSNRKLVWALGQHSEVWVLRLDPKTADLQPLR
ncbi:MAG TPA: kelch repeat-containing protein [Gemmataceae bacterium]|nr:kelch repeat-containing protein [Gemmataceae bacterium]